MFLSFLAGCSKSPSRLKRSQGKNLDSWSESIYRERAELEEKLRCEGERFLFTVAEFGSHEENRRIHLFVYDKKLQRGLPGGSGAYLAKDGQSVGGGGGTRDGETYTNVRREFDALVFEYFDGNDKRQKIVFTYRENESLPPRLNS